MEIRILNGHESRRVLTDLAQLRITVFREWPYLYDGSLAYEQEYLSTFAACNEAMIVVACDDGRVVGASTASPLLGHAGECVAAFIAQGYDPETVYYFGESVLLPQYRGRGIGHAFFDAREAAARAAGRYDLAVFCAVVRQDNDPRKPAAYRPLDGFWKSRGFARADGLETTFIWKEPDQAGDIPHRMQFWIKPLR